MLKNKGFSLVELMVTLTITSILITSLITIYLAAVQKNQQTVEKERLDQTLQAAMELMVNDIRRAGYWGNAKADIATGANNNPFMSNDITINSAGNCILFSYDQNGDGTMPAITAASDDERYGFRLVNNILQARPFGASYDCSAAANAWENLSDPKVVTITQLNFSKNEKTIDIDGAGAGTASIVIRSVAITITGQLVSNTSITKTLTEQVRVRNDKYVP